MELPFVTLDVFTRTRFRGNPLAVVTIPADGPKPSQEQKQAVAREFNLSETVFVHEVAAAADRDGHDDISSKQRRIDIFITTAELPFAGHPTIGAAISILAQGADVDTLVTKAGPIPIVPTTIRDSHDSGSHVVVRADIPHNVHLHARRLRDVAPDHMPPSHLSPVPAIRQAELDAPVFSIVKGMNFVLVELPSLELLAQAVPRGSGFLADEHLLDPGWREGFTGRYYFVRTTATAAAVAATTATDKRAVVELRTRMIENTLEDPATGSAACCLSSYLSITENTAPDQASQYQITQGVEMGKESNILVDVSVKDAKVDSVALTGAAVQVMRGTITI
jgi:predicted PhzF superfamily epimerase YddE/YHI9